MDFQYVGLAEDALGFVQFRGVPMHDYQDLARLDKLFVVVNVFLVNPPAA